MKRNIIKGLLVCGAAVALTGCSENSWNEKYLDGFEEVDLNASTRNTIDYTLTSSDYSKIANMAANKTLAQESGVATELAAVRTNSCFSSTITPKEYLGAWLDSIFVTTGSVFKTALPYTTARVTYETALEESAVVKGINNASTYTVTTDDYVNAYAPGETAETAKYADAFSPMCTAASNVPSILKTRFPNAASGDYVYVTYNESTTNPVWASAGGSNEGGESGGETGGETSSFELSSVIGSMVKGDAVDVNAYISAICAQGMIITDNSGSCLAYTGKTFDATAWKVGQQLNITGTAGAYNGGAQVGSPVYGEVKGTQAISVTPEVMTATTWDALSQKYADAKTNSTGINATYVKVTATIVVDGSYINFTVDGAEHAGSFYQATDAQKAECTDGSTVTIEGWALSSSYSKNLSKTLLYMIPVYINDKAVNTFADGAVSAAKRKAGKKVSRAAAENFASSAVNAVYTYNGSTWSVPSNVYVVTAADYAKMGVTSLSSTTAKTYIPTLLANEYPYAADGAEKYVVYTGHTCSKYTLTDGEWATKTTETSTVQFILMPTKKWMYDPTVYLYFSSNYKTDTVSLAFYQACVSWVWNNINVAQLGIDNSLLDSWPSSITNYGYCWGTSKPTQEGYGGASAYYCNVDTRPYTLSRYMGDNYTTYYGGLSDDEVVALAQKRFATEVAPGAMGICYPDAEYVDDGVDRIYEVTLIQYNDGTKTSSHEVTFRFKVVAKGTFELESCESWGL
jgi:hypothetical protein